MTASQNLPEFGRATHREMALTEFLHEHIANWIDTHKTERRELVAALFSLCTITFCKQTHFDLKGQCEEIDKFAYYLKDFAMRNAESA